jgi:Asp/Glu/hydantoin racemase
MSEGARDPGVRRIQARQGHRTYGMGLGIIVLDEVNPGFPGDMRNASAYPFPMQFEIADGVDIQALTFEVDKSRCLRPIQDAARKLERMGCRAIVGECGYFAYFQKEIAAQVDVPVFLSTLLQVPWAQQLIARDKVVGIMAATKNFLTEAHLEAVGIRPGSNYVIAGLRESGRCPGFIDLYRSPEPDRRSADYDQLERELVQAALDFRQAHPNMRALVLECTGLPPFARAIQRALDLPVFSAGTLLDYAYSVVAHRDYYGHV